ncbi:right-handed parallel beta-helix repeat-containing protein [Aromatoleum aromaticum]|nr:right-handed parallel beta-helix repeat-containing protein [Aromatoleum aromaticum]NMG56198.1 hypothetical protein [Aromatoleum aromaticum]
MRLRAVIVSLLSLVLSEPARAATLRVGPEEAITTIAEVARLARDGDIVEIQPGEYRGDVASWTQRRLTIRGVGERPVLIADGRSAEDKATWVIRNGDFVIDNVEFRGARVVDGNGAGIRFERGRLHVRNCAFVDNQTGILTSNFSDAELRIDDSLFADAPRQEHSLPHLLYVGRIAQLEIFGSRFHNGYRGHLIKSRARRSDIRYNLIYDGRAGEASYEIDLPNGGNATLVGNVIGQSAATRNPVVVAYGAEGHAWADNALVLSHNTLTSARPFGAWFLRVWRDRIGANIRVQGINNLIVGLGAFTLGASGEFHGNFPTLSGMLNDIETLDFSLAPGSLLHGRGKNVAASPGDDIVPDAEFQLPIGRRPLTAPAQWTPGAFQRAGDAR